MDINEATDFLKSLLNETDKKSEIKIYEDFIVVLDTLRNRNLKEEELQSIENQLNNLKLKENSVRKKKHFSQKLSVFKTYFKKEFSFITKGYYSTLGIALGPGFGMVLGIILLSSLERSVGMVYGMIGGLILGQIIGSTLDAKAEKENRVLNP